MSLFLQIKNLTYQYNATNLVFKNISFSQNAGANSLWVGPSGFGKSTMAQMIAGHLAVQKGEILLFGRQVSKPSLDCFYVGPENDLFLWKTLRQQFLFLDKKVTYNRKLLINDVENWAQELEIENLLDAHPTQLSTGQMRRFQILRTLFLNSSSVIFDETFSALDLKLKNRILPRLQNFWKTNGTSVVIISHETDKTFDLNFESVLDFSEFEG